MKSLIKEITQSSWEPPERHDLLRPGALTVPSVKKAFYGMLPITTIALLGVGWAYYQSPGNIAFFGGLALLLGGFPMLWPWSVHRYWKKHANKEQGG